MVIAGPVYLDSSALAKLYVPESESEALNSAFLHRTDLLVADLALTEVVSALCRRRSAGEIAPEMPERAQLQIRDFWEQGIYGRPELTPHVYRAAEHRLLQTRMSPPLRGMDALHLALALNAGALTLASYDRRLRAAAAAAGLALYPA